MTQLIKWERAKQAIIEAKTIDEVKTIRDKAEAMRAYAKQIGESHQVQNDIADIKIRAEHHIGQMLQEMELVPGRPAINSSSRNHLSNPTLTDLGISKRQSYKWQHIAKLPEEQLEKCVAEIKAIPDQELTTAAILREATKYTLTQKEYKEPEPFEGLYDVIIIDPPWPMEKIERDERPMQAQFDYPTMTEDQLSIFKLPAKENCHLFAWTTEKFLLMALRLLPEWGFRYVCTFVWHKNGGFQPVGLPQYNAEFVLYARKGSPQFIDTKDFKLCFNAERGAHSEKPLYFYEMIRRVTDGRRLDIFSRKPIEGYDAWGNELDAGQTLVGSIFNRN